MTSTELEDCTEASPGEGTASNLSATAAQHLQESRDEAALNPYMDVQGGYLTAGLLFEVSPSKARYTMKDRDIVRSGKRYLSLRQGYLNCNDLTGYKFAEMYFDNWRHFQLFRKVSRKIGTKTVAEHVLDWEAELEVKLRSEALLKIVNQSHDNFQAAKFVVNQGWIKSPSRAKEAVAQRRRGNAKVRDAVRDDAARLGIEI